MFNKAKRKFYQKKKNKKKKKQRKKEEKEEGIVSLQVTTHIYKYKFLIL